MVINQKNVQLANDKNPTNIEIKNLNEITQDFSSLCYINSFVYSISNATQNRQDAVKKMIKSGIELLIVIGSQSSSNSNRLAEIGTKNNIPSYLIDGKQDIKLEWLTNITKIGITAGASAHETFVQEVIEYLSQNFETQTQEIEGEDENVVFFAPKIIRDLDK